VVDTDDWEGPGGWNDLAPYTRLQRRFFAWQERWGLTHADAVTVASRTLQSLVWALGVPPEHVLYVPNGLPRPGVQGEAPHHERRPTLLLYTRFFEFPVGRVIDLLRRVEAQVPQVHLLVVGQGLFGEEAELMTRASQVGLDDRITFAGWVEPADLPPTFARAAVAIYPFDDTLVNRAKCPVKLLELLAAGVPVVAEAVGEIREVIRCGQTGWLVAPGDSAAFAQAVVRLLEDAALRDRIASAAREDIRARRNWDQLVETVERAYQLP
jgi:glycosyltransferase involved in cell wall biosynthesis